MAPSLDEEVPAAPLTIRERVVEFHDKGDYTDFAIVFRVRNEVLTAAGYRPQSAAERLAEAFPAAILSAALVPPEPLVGVDGVGSPIQWFPEGEKVDG